MIFPGIIGFQAIVLSLEVLVIYGFKPLYVAKNKFNPKWKSTYVVCYPKHMSFWMEEAAFAVLDSQGFSDYVHAYLEMRRVQHEKKHPDKTNGRTE